MTEPLLDFACHVGKYEIKQFDELAAKDRKSIEGHERLLPQYCYPNLERLFLVQVGPAKLIKPKRDALNFAVGLLLKTDTGDLDEVGFSKLKRNVLLISRRIGLLEGEDDKYWVGTPEPLTVWVIAARHISGLFQARDLQNKGVFADFRPEESEVEAGLLKIWMSYHSNRPSIHLRPNNTLSALYYCAAQMIARGITAHVCDNCSTPFMEGGERGGRNKRRGARFCSDKCRYSFHYDVRRKKKL